MHKENEIEIDTTEWLFEQVKAHGKKNENCKEMDATVTINAILDFATYNRWIIIQSDEYREHLNTLLLEFECLSTEGSNDEGLTVVPHGSATIQVGENPDLILQDGVKGTILENRIVYSGINRDTPHRDFDPNTHQLSYPFLFLSGDGCPYQDRFMDIKADTNWRRKWLRWIIQQKDACKNERLQFQFYNIIRHLQSWTNATLVMGKINKANDVIPTRHEIENDAKLRNNIANNILQYKANVDDSKEFWYAKKKDLLGASRHLGHVEEWQDRKYPSLQCLFSTFAANYMNSPLLHNLLSHEHRDDLSKSGNAQWQAERKANYLSYPNVVETFFSLTAELETKYLSMRAQCFDYFFLRSEWGKNANPHWHRVAFSRVLGELVAKANDRIERVKENLTEKNQHLLSEKSARKEVEDAVKWEWEEERKSFVKDSVPKMAWNWNAARDKNGNRFKGVELLDRNAIARLNMVEILKKALETGWFENIDRIYNSIVESTCRHKMHTGAFGKDGLPIVGPKDYCAKAEKVVDKKKTKAAQQDQGKNTSISSKNNAQQGKHKKASVPGKKVKKTIYVCKRRFPRPIIKKRQIYQDPHKKSIYLVSTASNDNFYNAHNPDRVLFHLSNCDDKVTVPGFYKKPPIITWGINGEGLTEAQLEFYLDDEETSNYTIKYSLKGVR